MADIEEPNPNVDVEPRRAEASVEHQHSSNDGSASAFADNVVQPKVVAADTYGAGATGGAAAVEIDRMTEALVAHRELLDFMAHNPGFEAVLERIASMVERVMSPATCSIHLVEADGTFLHLRAAPSLPGSFKSAMNRVAIDQEAFPLTLADGPRQRLGVSDIPAAPMWRPLAGIAARHGHLASHSKLVLGPGNEVLGVITLYDDALPGRNTGDLRFLEALASLTALTVVQERSERSKRTTDTRFASLAETIPGVVYQRRVSPDGDIRYTYISEAARDLFGVSPEEILADPNALFDCHGPDYRATFRERLLKASRDLTLWDVEAQIITRDGQEKWTHAIARPHREPDGSVLWDGVILDATRIKKAESELRKATEAAERAHQAQVEILDKLRSANARFASLAETIPGVVYQRRVSPDGDIRYTYISEAARDLFGVSPEEILADPKALFDCHGPDYRATFRERLLKASRDLTLWDVEAQIITRDGKEKWTHAIARPHREPDGSVLWDGVILDATRIKKAELAATASALYTRKVIVESIAQGYCLFDSDDQLVICNSNYLDLYPELRDVALPGASYEAIARRELESHGPTESGETLESQLSERLEKHSLPEHVVERRWPDGRWILISEHRSFDGSTVIFFTNITDLRRREENLRKVNRQLDIALENMAQGLCVFDSEHRIVLANRRYCEIFGLPLEMVGEGSSVHDHIKNCFSSYTYDAPAVQELTQERLRHIESRESATFFLNLPDGRTIEATHRPLADGTAVETFSEW